MQDQCTISHTNAIGVDLLSTPDLTGGNGVNAKPKVAQETIRPTRGRVPEKSADPNPRVPVCIRLCSYHP